MRKTIRRQVFLSDGNRQGESRDPLCVTAAGSARDFMSVGKLGTRHKRLYKVLMPSRSA